MRRRKVSCLISSLPQQPLQHVFIVYVKVFDFGYPRVKRQFFMCFGIVGNVLQVFVETSLKLQVNAVIIEMGSSVTKGHLERLYGRGPFFEVLFLWIQTGAQNF